MITAGELSLEIWSIFQVRPMLAEMSLLSFLIQTAHTIYPFHSLWLHTIKFYLLLREQMKPKENKIVGLGS